MTILAWIALGSGACTAVVLAAMVVGGRSEQPPPPRPKPRCDYDGEDFSDYASPAPRVHTTITDAIWSEK